MSTIVQRSFSGGEIAPALYARTDTIKYATGLRTCRNMMVMRHGGATNRPGTLFVGEVKDSTKTVRLVPFIFSADQTYVLEFGNLSMRVIRSGAYVTETELNISNITQASQAVVTITLHGYSNGDEVYLSGIGGMTELNGRNFKISDVTGSTFKIKYLDGTYVDSSLFGAFTSGGTSARVFSLTTPYLEADLSTLQFAQSFDIVNIVHPSYAPRELSRLDHDDWSLAATDLVPDANIPSITSLTGGSGPGPTSYVVTSIAQDTFEESLPSSAVATSNDASSANPITVNWNDTGAYEYNVYKASNGIYGFIGTAGSTSFIDAGIVPDTLDTPPVNLTLFSSADNYPAAVSYYQQRLLYANTNNDPQKAWASRSASFHNFTVSVPTQDDNSISFTLAGRQVNQIKHMVDIGTLIFFTSAGEWSIQGNQSGVLTPTDINPKQYSYNGSSDLAPIIIANNAIYVQARGSIVRDLSFDFQIDGYRGNDLTIFSAHLFDKYTLSDWAYQQIPHSIIWAARSDGTLIGLTYVKEQQILGWHRHDFEDATVENVCVVPENNEDVLYLVINRTIDGRTVRYVEKMETRQIDAIEDSIFLDSCLSYDGTNTNGAHSMTLATGTTWSTDETITLISNTSNYFTSDDVGNSYTIYNDDGDTVTLYITEYLSDILLRGTPNKTVPVSLRGVPTLTWIKNVDEVSGLWHLEGKNVSVFADGFVIANPNNDAYEIITVADGAITLPRAYSKIHVGLPYTSDLETLDVDSNQGETLMDKNKNVNKLTVYLESSRGFWAGAQAPDENVGFLDGLYELKIRSDENYDEPIALKTGTAQVIIRPEWNSNGRIFIRNTDPIPMTILAVAPAGLFPFRS